MCARSESLRTFANFSSGSPCKQNTVQIWWSEENTKYSTSMVEWWQYKINYKHGGVRGTRDAVQAWWSEVNKKYTTGMVEWGQYKIQNKHGGVREHKIVVAHRILGVLKLNVLAQQYLQSIVLSPLHCSIIWDLQWKPQTFQTHKSTNTTYKLSRRYIPILPNL